MVCSTLPMDPTRGVHLFLTRGLTASHIFKLYCQTTLAHRRLQPKIIFWNSSCVVMKDGDKFYWQLFSDEAFVVSKLV